MKRVVVAGTFDSKGKELNYLKEIFETSGIETLTIHTGTYESTEPVDLDRRELLREKNIDVDDLIKKGDRSEATEILAGVLEEFLPKLYNEGAYDGIISLGGSGGTSLVAPGMRNLPIGVPKIIVSTMASGNTSQYVSSSDLILMPSVVDVSGLNSILKRVLQNAANAMVGMLSGEALEEEEKKPHIAATMFGVTTPSVDQAREYLEEQGFEVVVFHATGAGGMSMESLIEQDFFDGVLDLTTTEWCDEVVGGVLAAGPHRLESAAKTGVPQVISVGALDMVNFGPYDTVPEKFKGRNLYKHNPTVTLMRTTEEELIKIGEEMVSRINESTGPTTVLLPLQGVSAIDTEEGPFYGPRENEVLFNIFREKLRSDIDLIEVDANINDESFSILAAKTLMENMERGKEDE